MKSIAENRLCSGCGVCSVVCPKNCIAVCENERGELRPGVDTQVCVSCGQCTSVCPFCTETQPANDKCEDVFIGTAPDFSANGSSGGAASYLIDSLLRQKAVDHAVLVAPQNDCDQLFNYTVCDTAEDIVKCQGSAYYPVTLEKVLKEMQSADGTFAVIGVPCFINALKNLKDKNPLWNKKIKILIGVVCGHTPNKHLVDCLAHKSGHKRQDITGCRFRIKEADKPSWDYGVRLEFSDKSEIKSFGSDDFGYLFWRRLFIQNCCTNCRDVFAKNADVTFMDAWLPEYKEKKHGTSLVVCRNEELENYFTPLIEAGYLKKTDHENICKAQEKLVLYKNNAGNHSEDERIENEVQKIFAAHKGEPDIVDRIRRLCYKEELKKKNKVLWLLTEIKDKIKG